MLEFLLKILLSGIDSLYGKIGSWHKRFLDDFHDGDYKSDSAYVRAAKEF